MNRISAFVFVALLAVLATGCDSNDPKAKMRRAIAEYSAATEVIATVRDKASFEAAKPKLQKHCDWLREQNREAQAMQKQGATGNTTDPQAAMKEYEKLSKEPEFKQLMDVSMKYANEMIRAVGGAGVPRIRSARNETVRCDSGVKRLVAAGFRSCRECQDRNPNLQTDFTP